MTTFEVIDEIPAQDGSAVYTEGWQSWSPTGWWSTDAPRPAQAWQHAMRFRPDKPIPDTGAQGEGLLVVDRGNDSGCVRYATGSITTIPSIRAHRRHSTWIIESDHPVHRTTHPDRYDALTTYPAVLNAAPTGRPAPTVWCSWYRYFENVTAEDVLHNVQAMDSLDLPVDVVLVDDGWATGWGDYLQPRPHFGDLPTVIDAIRSSGRRAGLWLAPFLSGAHSALAQEHPDMVTGYAGHNWGDDLLGCDVGHPGMLDLLNSTISRLVALGVDYFKLDFLYAGALTSPSWHGDVIGAYRNALQVIRDAAGDTTFIVGCGAPILPSIGLVDAMRIAPDTFHEDVQDGSRGLRGAQNLQTRSWQHGRFWINDPDCVIQRPSFALRDSWADLASTYGGLRSVSDNLTELDAHGLDQVRRLLERPIPAGPFPTCPMEDMQTSTLHRSFHSPLGQRSAPHPSA